MLAIAVGTPINLVCAESSAHTPLDIRLSNGALPGVYTLVFTNFSLHPLLINLGSESSGHQSVWSVAFQLVLLNRTDPAFRVNVKTPGYIDGILFPIPVYLAAGKSCTVAIAVNGSQTYPSPTYPSESPYTMTVEYRWSGSANGEYDSDPRKTFWRGTASSNGIPFDRSLPESFIILSKDGSIDAQRKERSCLPQAST